MPARKLVQACTEIGALEHPPSGISSGSSSGERGARRGEGEPLDVAVVPELSDGPPSRYCHRHSETNSPPCYGCRDAGRAAEAWEADRVAAEKAERQRRYQLAQNCATCEGTNWIPDTDPAVRCPHAPEARQATA